MLNLETTIKLDAKVAKSPNLASRFSTQDLEKIGDWVWDGYERDESSRERWLTRMQSAMDLALQLQKDKTFPWPGASNVAFPLITIATMQFHARAYPALVSGPDIVKCRVVGPDPDGKEMARALRVGCHMSYQVLEEDASWEEQHDRLLINLPIVGCAFKKSYHSPKTNSNRSELVLAKDLVMDYYAKSTETCMRKTHVIPLYRNEMIERMVLGTFVNYTDEAWFQTDATPFVRPSSVRTDQRQGTTAPQPDSATPFTTLEQHCWLDLDDDQFAEPYIITIDSETKKVLRIVARWASEADISRSGTRIFAIRAEEYFTKYSFCPAPDAGIYDLGFGILLGPLNESTNSLINQLIDAGTMATTAGGFLARGAKIRGGAYTFAPLEWKRVDSTGDDLKKSIFPLPVREPSPVLFNLLSLLINYTERIAGSTDIMVGENIGQNTPKGTADALVEQGSKIYSAIFKRVWRSMKEEFKKLYLLNAYYMPDTLAFGMDEKALKDDYLGDPNRIVPAADPNVVSDQARMQQAVAIKQAAAVTPGYDPEAVERNYLRAFKVDGVEILFPGVKKFPPGKNMKLAIEEMKGQIAGAKLQQQHMEFVITMLEQQRLNSAMINELTARAAKEAAEAGGVAAGHELAAFDAHLGALKAHDEALQGRIALLLQHMEIQNDKQAAAAPDGE